MHSDRDSQYSDRIKFGYRTPHLKQGEWDLLNYRLSQEIKTSDNYLDSATKWIYNESKGTKVFAIYGVGDGTEPTVLYAVGGKKAIKEYNYLSDVLKGADEHVDRGTRSFERRIENFLTKRQGKQIDNRMYIGGGISTNRDVKIHERQYGSNSGADNSRSTEDSESGISRSDRDRRISEIVKQLKQIIRRS